MKIIAAVFAAVVLNLGGTAQAAGIKSAGLDHVGVTVPDLKQAQEFLRTTFGCESTRTRLAAARCRSRKISAPRTSPSTPTT